MTKGTTVRNRIVRNVPSLLDVLMHTQKEKLIQNLQCLAQLSLKKGEVRPVHTGECHFSFNIAI